MNKKYILSLFLLLFIILIATFAVSAQAPNGTYVQKNEMAKQIPIAKFEFAGGKLKMYFGIMGFILPTAYEYPYTLKGNTLSIKEGDAIYEFTYNKLTDEISLNMDYAYAMLGNLAELFGPLLGINVNSAQAANELKKLGVEDPVWYKEGNNNPNNKICIGGVPAPQLDYAPQSVKAGDKCTIRWKPISCATGYIVYWSFVDIDGKQKDKGQTEWITQTEWILNKVPNECGYLHFSIYARDDEKNGQTGLQISNIEVKKKFNGEFVKYDHELAKKCALYSEKVYEYGAGIKELEQDGYHYFISIDNTSENGVRFSLAHKIINGNEVEYIVVIRGTEGNEWFGNMDIGENSVQHKSFQIANEELLNTIRNNIKYHKLKNINFMITGHSRGAAVANLLAADLNDGKICEMKSVVAYTFATPNCTKDPKNSKEYNNIFNHCFDDDFVTQVPLENWHYSKNGKTFKISAENLSKTNTEFKVYCESNKLKFDEKATKKVINDFYDLSPSIYSYYNDNDKILIKIMPFGPTEYIKPYEFMLGVANALVNDNSEVILKAFSTQFSSNVSDYKKIALFFVFGSGELIFHPYIDDTHNIKTYRNALKAKGFPIK